mmetsp:Transcript_86279/g.272180  ORF Transcript_86279/g.272180 Transcript_86279/m.272180 type:complete len:366 (+) Transcript_86279:964-2061(+)
MPTDPSSPITRASGYPAAACREKKPQQLPMSMSEKGPSPKRRPSSTSIAAHRVTKCDQGRSMYVNSASGSATMSRLSGSTLLGAATHLLAPPPALPRPGAFATAAPGSWPRLPTPLAKIALGPAVATACPTAAAALATEGGTVRAPLWADVSRLPPLFLGFTSEGLAAPRVSSLALGASIAGRVTVGDMLVAASCNAMATAGATASGPEAARESPAASAAAAGAPTWLAAATALSPASSAFLRRAARSSRASRSARRSTPGGSRSSPLAESSTKPQLSSSLALTGVISSRRTRCCCSSVGWLSTSSRMTTSDFSTACTRADDFKPCKSLASCSIGRRQASAQLPSCLAQVPQTYKNMACSSRIQL